MFAEGRALSEGNDQSSRIANAKGARNQLTYSKELQKARLFVLSKGIQRERQGATPNFKGYLKLAALADTTVSPPRRNYIKKPV